MNVIALVFPKLQAAKDVVRQMSKKPRFRRPLESQHVKVSQTLVKSARHHFNLIFLTLWQIFSWKTSLLMICEILWPFINTVTATDEYFLHNSEDLPQPIQMQISKKQKTFFSSFAAFLKFAFTVKYFEENDDFHS